MDLKISEVVSVYGIIEFLRVTSLGLYAPWMYYTVIKQVLLSRAFNLLLCCLTFARTYYVHCTV